MREIPILKINLKAPETFGNLAEKLDIEDRRRLAVDLIELIDIDAGTMSDWLGRAQGHIDKIKAKGNAAPQNREQEGSGEEPPPGTEMTLAAVIQFTARATDALLGEPDLAKASEPGGENLATWVSSQVRTKDPNWVLDTDPLVVHMGVTGLAWRKRDFDDQDRVFHSHFLRCSDVKINANVRSIERAPRITHEFERYPYEIQRSIERKKWIDYEPQYDEKDPQAPKRFYETDAWLDLDDDGIDEPWTVVISRDDFPEVVRIRPRWSKKTVVDTDEVLFFNPIRRFYPYCMLPDPDGGFLPMGFGELLSRMENSADRLLASIVDTAESEAENGGVAGGSAFGLPDKIELKGNRLTTIPTDGQPLDQLLHMFPAKSVSSGSVAVLEKILTLGDRLSGTLNLMENAPASMTATLAKGIIDTGTQVQSAVHRRLCASMTQEFRMFVQMADAYDELPDGVLASDGNGVAVTADPQLATEMQRTALAGVYKELLVELPMVFDTQEIGMRLLKVLRIPDPEKCIAPRQAPQASPWEKMQGALGLAKAQTEKIKVTGAIAVQLTQALKNLVDAGGGMIDQRAGMLQVAQLEHVVQQMIDEASNAGSGLNGMASQPGNAASPGLPAPPPSDSPANVLAGSPGNPNGPGTGSGLA